MKIREITPEDIGYLEELYVRCRTQTFSWIPRNSFHLADFLIDTKGEEILVLEDRGDVVGFCSVWRADNFLHHLYIDTSYQGKGFGKLLLNTCLKKQILKLPARLKCVARNKSACKFYEKLGWKIESTTDEGPMGTYHTYVLY